MLYLQSQIIYKFNGYHLNKILLVLLLKLLIMELIVSAKNIIKLLIIRYLENIDMENNRFCVKMIGIIH
jgi:glutamate formiminotransferase